MKQLRLLLPLLLLTGHCDGFVAPQAKGGLAHVDRLWSTTETKSTSVVEEKSDTAPSTQDVFVNDGPFAILQPFLNLFGMTEGKTLYGALPLPQPDLLLSDDEATRRRIKATNQLTNISPEERGRRAAIGNVLTYVTVVYTLWSTLVLDTGDFAGHVFRFMTMFPLFFAAGFRKSAETGL